MNAVTASTENEVPRSAKITAALCWVGWVFDFYDLILIAFLIKQIEHSLGISEEMGPWLIGIGLGASGLGGVLFGALGDRFGRKKTLTFTIVLFSLGMLLTSFVQTVPQFLAARFLTGLGLGGEWAIGHALVAESVPAATRARWSAFLQSGEPFGVALAAIVGFWIAPAMGWDWRTIFMLSSLTGFLALVFRSHLSESPIWLKAEPKDMKTRIHELKPFLKSYWLIMVLALVMASFKLGTYWTCYSWLPRFIEKTMHVALERSVPWLLCGQVGQFLGMMLFGVAADKIGRRLSFTLYSLATVCALLPLALFWDELFGQPLFWILLFLLGLGSGCTAGFGALLSELFPTQFRTFAMGTTYNLARGVQAFTIPGVGMAVAAAGITGGLLVPTSLALCTAVWVWTLPEKKGQSLTSEDTESVPTLAPQSA